MARPHEFIFVDEAGFNLTKRRRRGRNIIGRRAIVDVPGQRGGNITLCAAMSSRGLLHRHAELGAYNTERLLTFLGELRDVLHDNDHLNARPADHHDQQIPGPADLPIYVILWDNVSSHRSIQVREWFNINQQFINVCLPPYSPFLNPIEEFFSSWRWKVYDRQLYTRENLLRAMDLACDDVAVEAFQGWVRHAGHSSHVVWLWTILPVTLMRSCGPTQPDDVMPPHDFGVKIQHTVSIFNVL